MILYTIYDIIDHIPYYMLLLYIYDSTRYGCGTTADERLSTLRGGEAKEGFDERWQGGAAALPGNRSVDFMGKGTDDPRMTLPCLLGELFMRQSFQRARESEDNS